VHAVAAASHPPAPPDPRLAYALLFQNAWAFNQPLSFDTAKVTGMRYMFRVRPARALVPEP